MYIHSSAAGVGPCDALRLVGPEVSSDSFAAVLFTVESPETSPEYMSAAMLFHDEVAIGTFGSMSSLQHM